MYKILGADGKEYGPINADELRQWIAQRRAVAATLARVEGGGDWKPLATFPEFAEALAGSQEAPAFGGFTPASTPPSGPVKTSGLAIASLVCGILGFLCLPALAGLVLGVMALVKISNSKGQLRGQGLAIAGICLSGIMLLVVPVEAGLLLPALARAKARSRQFNSTINNPMGANGGWGSAKDRAQKINCVNNLKQICLAARIYCNDNKDIFPPDFLSMSNELSTPRILVCPADTEHTGASSWAEFDPLKNVSYEYLKPGIAEGNAINEVIFRCKIHNNVGMGDGSVRQLPRR
jgi:hypothetical protein